MPRFWSAIAISRGGTALPGSPFQARVFLARSLARRHEVVPDATKAQTSRVLSLQDNSADIRVGDIAILPGAVFGKVIDTLRFTRTLQCELQIVPYAIGSIWVPDSVSSRIAPLVPGGIADGAFHLLGTALVYLEPSGDLARFTLLGRFDCRTVRCFSAQGLTAGCVVRLDDDCWYAGAGSEHWPVTNDWVTVLTRLDSWPVGVI